MPTASPPCSRSPSASASLMNDWASDESPSSLIVTTGATAAATTGPASASAAASPCPLSAHSQCPPHSPHRGEKSKRSGAAEENGVNGRGDGLSSESEEEEEGVPAAAAAVQQVAASAAGAEGGVMRGDDDDDDEFEDFLRHSDTGMELSDSGKQFNNISFT